ncbi:secretion/DNA translocation related TadE-like protein [Mycolicibacterium iranicum]|uniref:Secretion/DNA translocation related TadE-like protein n=1 Tax=Mycolicibacterium iranicum TaxID=912594 RepID=A0A839QD69_MYCIR|nr:Rv3654c family TadE-like protein [Mycolicibacterium iranicum]MBB2992136.1 secretion/DNA translocation related TadE-like protein [Mycolicibacterium iranicum]
MVCRLSSRAREERGAASVIAAAMCAALVAVTVGGAQIGAAVIARHRAQAAADLAALAAAAAVPAGRQQACAQASAVARAMSVTAVDCVVDGLDAVVTVEARAAVRLFGAGPARAVARAGPDEGGTG